MITYLDYIKLLSNKNIKLYDYQKRISHFRFNGLLSILNQKGGGYYESSKVGELDSYHMEKIIYYLLEKEYYSAKKLLRSYF
jgi:hypothetical protein